MKIKYLSHAQAHALTQDYQHLVGQPFGEGAAAGHSILAVVVSPYSRILQWSFTRQVVKGTPPADALRQWPGDRFDVILISANPGRPSDFQLKDLRSYLADQGIALDVMRYKRLKSA